MIRILPSIAVLVMGLLGTFSQNKALALPEDPPLASPIVGGEKEGGWMGVGALIQWSPGLGYVGSFCSGTLIAPDWVLTAAHCLSATDGNPAPLTPLTRFLIGPDARPADIGVPPEGTRFYQADRFYVHPDYDPLDSPNDVALMHLSESALGMPTYLYSHITMDDTFVGDEVFYVGYGVTSGDDQMGGSQKRSVNIAIIQVRQSTYRSSEEGVGVCFGDSGGPGFLELDGQWQVVGVNSMVQGSYDNPCAGTSIQSRVDVFSHWIDEHLEQGPPSCVDDPELCWCPAACNSNGYCNNAKCQTRTCNRMYRCIRNCDEAEDSSMCQALCFVKAPEDVQMQFHQLVFCSYLACSGLTGEEEEECRKKFCPDSFAPCDPTPEAGTASCEEIIDCVANCSDDSPCKKDCFATGAKDAQQLFDPLWDCAEDSCGQLPQHALDASCLWEKCAAPLERCAPPQDCRPEGGDCGEDATCAATPMGRFDCFATDGKQEGDACSLSQVHPLPCADGLLCTDDGDGEHCIAICAKPADCEAPLECIEGAFPAISNIGTCQCIDEDEDGTCRTEDCDDSDPSLGPQAQEACDGIDNDCDGEIDEGCGEADVVEEPANDGNSSGGCTVTKQSQSAPTFAGLLLLLLLALLLGRTSATLRQR